jgi:hypothetical protein
LIEIPFKARPAFIERVTFDDRSYYLYFTWNSRGEFWSFSIGLTEGEPIVSDIKLILDFDLLSPFKNPELPQGKLFIIDTIGNQNEIGRDDFNNERKLSIQYIEYSVSAHC